MSCIGNEAGNGVGKGRGVLREGGGGGARARSVKELLRDRATGCR